MIVYYKQNCKRQTLFLLSYLGEYGYVPFETRAFDPKGTLDEIENSEDNYILFSNIMPRDLTLNTMIIERIKNNFSKLKINIVLGGTLFSILHNRQVMDYIPGISHICEGKGEGFLKELVEKRLPPGVYHSEDFPPIEHYVMKQKYLSKVSLMLITFDDNRCTWNRCKFCHHRSGQIRRKGISADRLVDDVVTYHRFGINHFYFYDNDLDPNKLHDFLGLLHEKIGPDPDIAFWIFGIRADHDFSMIKPLVWRKDLLREIAIGAEFYSQHMLDLYNKGITTSQIDECVQTFLDMGADVHAYFLFGAPGELAMHLKETRAWIEKHRDDVFIRASFFRLSTEMAMFGERNRFKIETGDFYKINEIKGGETLPPIDTKYIKFTSWDDDEKRRVTREEVLRKTEAVLGDALSIRPYLIFKNGTDG